MKRTTLTRRIGTLVGVLGLSAVGLLTAAPAQAALSDCDSGRLCIFQYSNGSGKYGSFTKGTDNLGSSKVLGGKMDNKASAIWNRTSVPWCVHQYKDQKGHAMMIPAGAKGNLNVVDPRDNFSWDNKITSLRTAIKITPPRNPGAAYWYCPGDEVIYRG